MTFTRSEWHLQILYGSLLLLCLLHKTSLALPETIKIGGLFDIWDRFDETAFRHQVERVNAEASVLPRSRLNARLERLPTGDSFHASKKVCQLLKEGVAAIIGPQMPATASHVQSVCDALQIPHIETKWDFRSSRGNFMINLYPHPATLSRAYADLIESWGWEKYVIIYENNESLVKLQDILKDSDPKNRQATTKQLPLEDDYRPLFKDIRLQTDISNIIIDCDTAKLPTIFEHARQTGMIKDKKYFLTSLDIHTLDPDQFTSSDVNITAYRIVDPMNAEVQNVVNQWQSLVLYGFQNKSQPTNFFVDEAVSSRNRNKNRPKVAEPIPPLENNILMSETALMYDAVELLSRALHALDSTQPQRINIQSLNCKSPAVTWQYGFLIMDALKKMQFEGLTGIVEFDQNGFRSNFQLDIMELTQTGLTKIGVWDSRANGEKFHWTRTAQETLKQQEGDLKGKTLIVSTKIGNPYCMDPYKNGTYIGYAVDLIAMIADHFEFDYIVKIVKDNKYGNPNNLTGQWDGMIGEILSGDADVAVADLSINYDRERTVDFTMPFMNLGISILYKKPTKKPPSLFSFLEPFNPEVWIYMATAYLGVSLILFVLARITPYDWQEPPPCSGDYGEILENQFNLLNSLWFATGSMMGQGCDILPKITPYQWLNPHPCKDDPDELENDLNLSNAMWHNWGSLMQQGSDIAPKAASTRMVAGIWWFFTLIMISSYTANLAAFLTSEGLEGGITDITDLPKQTKVKYGCVDSGTTAAFFRDSNFPLYKEIWNNMVNMKPSPFEKGSQGGKDRVSKSDGKYAFFMESISIEYNTERDCDLTQIGGLLDSKGYGIALRKNSKYREAFSSRILGLQEQGELEKLKRKWWQVPPEAACKTETAAAGGAQALTLGHVGGVFVVLLGGCTMACIMAVIEFLWKSRKLARNEGESLLMEMAKELRFALLCQGDTKPVRKSKPPEEQQSLGGSVPYLAFDRREPSD